MPSLSIQRILAATDLSARGDRAVARAAKLAARSGADLTVLYVIDDELPAALFANQQNQAESLITAQIKGVQSRLTGPLGSISGEQGTITIRVIGGRPGEAILSEMTAWNADLVVLGNHRRLSIYDLLLGTTLRRVSRNTTRPLLIARGAAGADTIAACDLDGPEPPYTCAVIAVELIEAAVETMACVASLAPLARIHLVHALDPAPLNRLRLADASDADIQSVRHELEKKAIALLIELAERAGIHADQLSPRIVWGDPAREIGELAETLGADLVAVGSHADEGPIERFLFGGAATSLLNGATCDTLMVPLGARSTLDGADEISEALIG